MKIKFMFVQEVEKKMELKDIRNEFPILSQKVNGSPLTYLDNAATTQKPKVVLDQLEHYYETINSNVHRGVHTLSVLATEAMENSREKVRSFINAKKTAEIIFTTGTTGSINLVAYSYARKNLKKGDEILLSHLEHHSNIVPWQMIAEEVGAVVKVIPINEKGELRMEEFKSLLNEKTKIISVNYVSNSLGTINPIKEIISKGHAVGAKVMIDGAQAIAHLPVDVQELDCDFFAFSSHKLYGPTGVGILYGKEEILEDMPPFFGGGEMISRVSFEGTTFNELPFKFEAGTPNIAGNIILGTAIDFISSFAWDDIIAHEKSLLNYLTSRLLEIDDLRIIGTAENKLSVVSFLVGDTHPYDVGVLLDKLGIAVRTGQHCTEPLMDFFGISGTVRASLSIYNNKADVDRLVEGLVKVLPMLG